MKQRIIMLGLALCTMMTLSACSVLHTNGSTVQEKIFNVKDYGAVGDGVTLNTKALQDVIDACTTAGGGKIWVPAGKYVTGTLELKDNVTLSLDHGAHILGSQNLKDYPTDNIIAAREGFSECLLFAGNAKNITLEGLGVIDGQGTAEAFPKYSGKGKSKKRLNRPRLLRFENCTNVKFSGLTYKRPAFWGIHIIDCKEVVFTAVKVRMHDNQSNNDGLDIDGCENVLIENCDIKAGDDAICLKSSKYPCRNVVVRNCVVSSHTAALKCGTSSNGGFIGLDVQNCYFYDCPMGAIKLQIVDGGIMEDINISRIVMDNVGAPVFIRLGDRGRIYTRNTETGPNTNNDSKAKAPTGSVKGIRISDVVATVNIHQKREKLGWRDIAAAGPIMIAGIPGHDIEDVVLENFKISYPGTVTEKDANNKVPEDELRYPEQYFFGILPAWGAYIRHAKNITFKNVEMTLRDKDARQQIVLDDVKGFKEEK